MLAKHFHLLVGQVSTSIIRSSLFGRSPSLICFTATASPVPQLKALYTDPNAPLPKHSPKRCSRFCQLLFSQTHKRTHIVFQSRILHGLLLRRVSVFSWCPTSSLSPPHTTSTIVALFRALRTMLRRRGMRCHCLAARHRRWASRRRFMNV